MISSAAEPTQRVFFQGPDSVKQLESVVVGQGLDGVSAGDAVFHDGSRLVWRSYRDQVDDLGMRHVFSRQVLMPGQALAQALGEPYATKGFRSWGAKSVFTRPPTRT